MMISNDFWDDLMTLDSVMMGRKLILFLVPGIENNMK